MKGLDHGVSTKRMLERLETLAQYTQPGPGVTRLSFTEESEQVNRVVAEWMKNAGMAVRRDALNNLIGRYEGTEPEVPVLLLGSHLDTVVEGGKYDGILGVVAGIEVVQILYENGFLPKHPIEVIGFCDEEGTRFHTTLLGSRAMAGALGEGDLLARDKDGVTLAQAIQGNGLDPGQYQLAARDRQSILGYLELHIEQGPVLEELQQSCSAVSGIAGQSRYQFRVEGQAGHAGTVPVGMRRDALVGAAEMILEVERMALQDEMIVATVGKLEVLPGASNVIPGVVEGTLDVRSIDDERRRNALQEIITVFQHIAERRGLVCHFHQVMESSAVRCSAGFIETIESVMKDHGMKPIRLVSGAGHDAMAMASIADVGMLFVRCREGLSHHPDEYVSPEDMTAGMSLLLDVVLQLTTGLHVEKGRRT